MAYKLFIPKLNPVKFVPEGYIQSVKYNTRDMDLFRYQDTLSALDEPVNFFQPWQQSDTIRVQILTNVFPVTIDLVSCERVLIGSYPMVEKPGYIDDSNLRVFEVEIPLAAIAFGIYFLRMRAGLPQLATWVSEMFTVGNFPLSVLYEYAHDENRFDVIFETGIEFMFRMHGALREFTPGVERNIFVDQVQNLTQLSSRIFATRKLYIGITNGVADYAIERISAIFQCWRVLIDGKEYSLADGASFEPFREDLYPMSGWAIDVRPALANSSTETEVATGEEAVIFYNIEQGAFGNKSTPGASNIIQIINTL